MKYNFDLCPDRRGTESVKWDLYPGTLPLWVADMDFKIAPEIQQALQKRLDQVPATAGTTSPGTGLSPPPVSSPPTAPPSRP